MHICIHTQDVQNEIVVLINLNTVAFSKIMDIPDILHCDLDCQVPTLLI